MSTFRLKVVYHNGGIWPYRGFNLKRPTEEVAQADMRRYIEGPWIWERRADRYGEDHNPTWVILEETEPEANEYGQVHP